MVHEGVQMENPSLNRGGGSQTQPVSNYSCSPVIHPQENQEPGRTHLTLNGLQELTVVIPISSNTPSPSVDLTSLFRPEVGPMLDRNVAPQ